MDLTPELLQKCIEEYYFDPSGRGYYQYGNLLNSRNDITFYAPQILALANEPVLEYEISGYCEKTGGAIFRVIENPCRTSVIFSGCENAPNALTEEHLFQIYSFFEQINPNLTNEWVGS
jgi:hypothetical protein